MAPIRLGSLSHICLTVRDLAVSVPFYDQVMDFLGYRRSETHDDYVEWGGPAGWFILRPALAAMLGGLAMGYGARLAFGCNVGAYFSGIASGSLHGWLWMAAALAGTALGVPLGRRALGRGRTP